MENGSYFEICRGVGLREEERLGNILKGAIFLDLQDIVRQALRVVNKAPSTKYRRYCSKYIHISTRIGRDPSELLVLLV